MKGSPVISTKQCMGSTLFLKEIQQPGGKTTSLGEEGGEAGEKTLTINKTSRKIILWSITLTAKKNFVVYWNILWHAYIIQTFQSRTHFESFCLNVFTVEYLAWFAAGSDRLSVLPLPLSISFHWNCFFFLATLIFCPLPKKSIRKPARKVSVTATEMNLTKLSSSCLWISLSNSIGKPKLGIYITSFI